MLLKLIAGVFDPQERVSGVPMCIGQVKGGIYGVPFGLTKVFKSPGGGYLLFSFVLVPFTLFGLVDMCRYPCIVFVFVERSLLCWFLCFFESSPCG